jgi:hypothetical protein
MAVGALENAASLTLVVGSEALEFAFFAYWALSVWVVR